MADVNLDLGALYQAAFGSPTEAFNPNLPPVTGDTPLNRKSVGALGSQYYATDPRLGREYFMPVTVKYPDVNVSNQDMALLGGSGTGILNTWQLPFPFITIDCSKTIVETPLTERRGTVKELIQMKDYEITIRGFIISPNDDYPEEDITTMRNLYEVNTAISIRSVLTDIFLLRPDRSGSDTVVIKNLRFPGLKGVQNIEPYELTIVGDEILNLVDIS